MSLLCCPSPLRFADDSIELVRGARRDEPGANRLAPNQPRDPAQCLHVRARLRLRAGEQEKQSYRLTVHCLIGHGSARRAGNRDEIGESWGLPVRNCNAVANTGWELTFPLHDSLQDIGRGPVSTQQELDQFPQHAVLALGLYGDPDPVWRQQFREPQWSMSQVP